MVGRILMEPGGWDGIHLQRFEGHHTKDAVEIGRKEGIQNLPKPVIIEGQAREVGLEECQHTLLFQPLAHLVEGMMPIENREHQGLHTMATREHIARPRWQERVDDGGHLELAQHA